MRRTEDRQTGNARVEFCEKGGLGLGLWLLDVLGELGGTRGRVMVVVVAAGGQRVGRGRGVGLGVSGVWTGVRGRIEVSHGATGSR